MFANQSRHSRWASLYVAAAMIAVLAVAPPATAQTVVEQAPSLQLVPEDAAAYGAIFHNKDVFDNVVGSKAYAKVAEIDAVKMMLDQGKTQWEGITGDPAMKGVVAAGLDALSEEIFFYTDSSYIEFMKIYQEANAQGTVANLRAGAALGPGDPDPTAQLKAMLDVLANHTEKLQVPDMVIGMRVKDPDSAKGLVSLVKLQIEGQLAEMPPQLAKSFKEETIGDAKLITFKLDGGMVPWEEVPLDELGEPGKYDALIEKLKSMTLAISMGVKGNYLLISMGESNKHIAELGKGQGLAARGEFAKLAELNGKKLRSLSYVSKEASALTVESATAPALAMLAALPEALPDDIDDMLRKRIEGDVKEFAKDFQAELPEPGAMLSATTFSPRGFDTLALNWSENAQLDSSKPLTLLNHLGGTPIAYAVGRGKQNPEQYELLVKWLKKADGYIDQIVENEGGEEAGKYKKFRTAVDPLLTRLDKANREMLRPALADGQTALVLDAQITSTQWLALMPESPQPLPMFELAMVFGVSDADLLKQGCQEYFAVANEVIKILHDMEPEQIPITEMPPPKERAFGESTIWYYMLPKDWGVDKRIAPNAGISTTAAALSLAPLHTKRLLEKSEPALAGPVAQYKDKPLGMAASYNNAALVDAVLPWVEYGVNIGPALEIQATDEAAFQPGPDEFGGGPDVMEYVRFGADVLKCFRGYSSVTYTDGDVQVTRGEWHFQDLE